MSAEKKNENHVLEFLGGGGAGVATAAVLGNKFDQALLDKVRPKITDFIAAFNEANKAQGGITIELTNNDPERLLETAKGMYQYVLDELGRLPDRSYLLSEEQKNLKSGFEEFKRGLGEILRDYKKEDVDNTFVVVGAAIGGAIVAGVAIWAVKKCFFSEKEQPTQHVSSKDSERALLDVPHQLMR